MTVRTYPLHWPQGFPRWNKSRTGGGFRTDFDKALRNVRDSLVGFSRESGKAVSDPVLSSNIDTNPLSPSRERQTSDPGVAVWFTWDGMQICIPVDRYDSPAANLQAIHHILEARRTELRHGTLSLVRASFTGFQALPAPEGKHWRDILALPKDARATKESVEAAYRSLARTRHPDQGGTKEAMAELNNARQTALREIGA